MWYHTVAIAGVDLLAIIYYHYLIILIASLQVTEGNSFLNYNFLQELFSPAKFSL